MGVRLSQTRMQKVAEFQPRLQAHTKCVLEQDSDFLPVDGYSSNDSSPLLTVINNTKTWIWI